MLRLTKEECIALEKDFASTKICFPLSIKHYCVVCSYRSTGKPVFVDRFSEFRNHLINNPSYCSDSNIFKYTLVELY